MNRIARSISCRSWRQLSCGKMYKQATVHSIAARVVNPSQSKKYYHSSSAVYMSTKRDYYEVLGVARNATKDEIKKKFR